VKLPWEYQRSSSRHHVLGERDLLTAEPDWLREEMRGRDYRGYVQRDARPGVTTAIRRMTANGRPWAT